MVFPGFAAGKEIQVQLVTQVQQVLPAYKFRTSDDDLSDKWQDVQVGSCCDTLTSSKSVLKTYMYKSGATA